MSLHSKLKLLRQAMVRAGVQACLIPSADPHLSEYLPSHWQIRLWLTGFTGSVGTVVVTETFAGVWVDSRYWVQAERDLAGSGFELMKIGAVGDSAHTHWLAVALQANDTLAVDGRALSWSGGQALEGLLKPRGVKIETKLDLISEIWLDRPALPTAPVYAFDLAYAGTSRSQKLSAVRREMFQYKTDWHVISTLDDVAWLLNLRGQDVDFNPVFMAHVLISDQTAKLFIDVNKVSTTLQAELLQDGFEVVPYELAQQALTQVSSDDSILFDPMRMTVALIDACQAQKVMAVNPSTLIKSRKTEHELEHVRQAMRHDGIALCEFLTWLEQAIDNRAQEPLTEFMLDEKLLHYRSQQPGFVSRSFATIAAFNANGAMPHYRATQGSHARIEGNGLLLLDSGAQYLGGTTDITRMIPVGELSDLQRADCTAVLRGMIALSQLTFPEGVASPLIDAVARAPLWASLTEYGHGTGHGVGYFLNVHEGPQVISYRAGVTPQTALQLGMITSNEPGLYRPNKWGVRIENLICCKAAGESEFGRFLSFETLTVCPIDTRCLDLTALHPHELLWLNQYHEWVRTKLAADLTGLSLDWLLKKTEPVSV
jgi:Xaa-Pro aminopeptidase